jgi:hypothetical protein
MTGECLGKADGYGFANIFDAKTSRLSRNSVLRKKDRSEDGQDT